MQHVPDITRLDFMMSYFVLNFCLMVLWSSVRIFMMGRNWRMMSNYWSMVRSNWDDRSEMSFLRSRFVMINLFCLLNCFFKRLGRCRRDAMIVLFSSNMATGVYCDHDILSSAVRKRLILG